MIEVLLTLGVILLAIFALVAGFKIGVKAAYGAVTTQARMKMNDAEYEEFTRLFQKVTG